MRARRLVGVGVVAAACLALTCHLLDGAARAGRGSGAAVLLMQAQTKGKTAAQAAADFEEVAKKKAEEHQQEVIKARQDWVAKANPDDDDDEVVSPEEEWEARMNTTARMLQQWGVVKDVRVLPNPDYMHRDASLPRALQGTSTDEVAERASRLAVDDLEEQRRAEEEIWAEPDDDMVAAIVPKPVDEAGAEAEEDEDEEEAALQRSKNLKSIRWIGPSRTAAAYVAAAHTSKHSQKCPVCTNSV